MKPSDKNKWLKFIEFSVVSIATWLNPQAGFLLFLLRLCFRILAVLQKEERDKTDKEE